MKKKCSITYNKLIVNILGKLEKQYSEHKYLGDFRRKEIFYFKKYPSYVCLSAPHSTMSTVHKCCKMADCYTGSIVQYIAEKNKFCYIVRKRYSVFKHMISTFVDNRKINKHYFLDVHAMKDRPFDLAIGLGYLSPKDYDKELTFIAQLCRKYNISYVVNHPSYTGQIGLTGRFQRKYKTANVIQLELTKRFRDFNLYPDKVLNTTIPFITELALFLNTCKKKKKYKIHVMIQPFQKIKNLLCFKKLYKYSLF